MILVLSCFDLVVVTITHPVLILSTISWSNEDFSELRGVLIWSYIYILLESVSMVALLTLNIERFLGLTFPIFHQASVTKKRLLILQGFLTILVFSPIALSPGLTTWQMRHMPRASRLWEPRLLLCHAHFYENTPIPIGTRPF